MAEKTLMSEFLRQRRNRLVATVMGQAEDVFVSAPDVMLDAFKKAFLVEVDALFDVFRDLVKADQATSVSRNDIALEIVMAVHEAAAMTARGEAKSVQEAAERLASK